MATGRRQRDRRTTGSTKRRAKISSNPAEPAESSAAGSGATAHGSAETAVAILFREGLANPHWPSGSAAVHTEPRRKKKKRPSGQYALDECNETRRSLSLAGSILNSLTLTPLLLLTLRRAPLPATTDACILHRRRRSFSFIFFFLSFLYFFFLMFFSLANTVQLSVRDCRRRDVPNFHLKDNL